MDTAGDHRPLRGLELRYALTLHLFEGQPRTIRELITALQADGFAIAGRPSKTISDALRWEVGRGRVVRLGRGVYGPGSMPRQTASRMRQRVRSLRLPSERGART